MIRSVNLRLEPLNRHRLLYKVDEYLAGHDPDIDPTFLEITRPEHISCRYVYVEVGRRRVQLDNGDTLAVSDLMYGPANLKGYWAPMYSTSRELVPSNEFAEDWDLDASWISHHFVDIGDLVSDIDLGMQAGPSNRQLRMPSERDYSLVGDRVELKGLHDHMVIIAREGGIMVAQTGDRYVISVDALP